MKEKSEGGRPDKLTAAVQKRILEAIELGAPYELAATYAGICRKTLSNWKIRGEAIEAQLKEETNLKKIEKLEKDKYFLFLHKMRQAEAKGMYENLQVINNAGEKDWKAAAWLLERRWPEHFGR